MPTVRELKLLCQQRLDEADDLLKLSRVDAAFYLSGYAVEYTSNCKEMSKQLFIITADAMDEDMDERLGFTTVVGDW